MPDILSVGDIDAFQHIILDALFAMDLTEDDFSWSQRPAILRLGPELVDMCFQYLRPKRKPRSICELHEHLAMGGYPTFEEKELMDLLCRDSRFAVHGIDWMSANVEVV